MYSLHEQFCVCVKTVNAREQFCVCVKMVNVHAQFCVCVKMVNVHAQFCACVKMVNMCVGRPDQVPDMNHHIFLLKCRLTHTVHLFMTNS